MKFDEERYRKLHQAYRDLWIKHFGPDAPRPFLDPQAGGPPPMGEHTEGIMYDDPVGEANMRTPVEQYQVDQGEYERRVLEAREENAKTRQPSTPSPVPDTLRELVEGEPAGD